MRGTPDHPTDGRRWSGPYACEDWIGSSAEAARIRDEIATASLSSEPVVIVGEGGTGRRFAAELIHRSSHSGPDAAESFVPIEAGSVPPGKLAAHLDVAAAGASGNGTGPGARTLYLSGIDRAGPMDFGSLASTAGVRLIASTAPPAKTSGNGRREVPPTTSVPGMATIRIPPLRERKMDISALALRFLADACDHAGVGPYGISSRMIAAYHDYDWPGNVAELRAVIESAVSTAALARFRGRVLPDSFCAICFDGDRSGRSFKEMIRDLERSILENTLHRVGGNQAHAARILQLNATTLHEKLKRHGMLRALRQRDAASPGP